MAEAYLEARFRLYRVVYMHKTTRTAEKMLEALLCAVADSGRGAPARGEPVLRYLTSPDPALGAYLAPTTRRCGPLSRAGPRAARTRAYRSSRGRLRDRALYKCVEIGARDRPGGTLYDRFRDALARSDPEGAGTSSSTTRPSRPASGTISTIRRR